MKPLRRAVAVLGLMALTVLALLGALWLWSGVGSSLATTLEQVARYLPGDQVLQARDVKGSVRAGGSIGWLRWQRGELSVEAHDVSVAWTLRPLLDGEFRFGPITVRELLIDDRRPAAPAPAPPGELMLPVKVDLPFSIGSIAWAGPPALQVADLAGHYVFDGAQHMLDVRTVRISQGVYQASARLQAQAPMALSVQLGGELQAPLPSGQGTVKVQASARLDGALAGRDAALALQAQLTPALPGAAATQASVSARILPWQAQPVEQAQASWQGLDLAALWPAAPQTRLDGDAAVTPDGQRWRASVNLVNKSSGPWDQQRLPLDDLSATVVYAQGQWAVESLQARAAGGRITAQGKFSHSAPDAPSWQGSATLQGINPAALDSRLAATLLDGELTARQTDSGIAFNTRLQPTARKGAARASSALAGLRITSLDAHGLWRSPLLDLQALQLNTDDAAVRGRLSWNARDLTATGQLALTAPGTLAQIAGTIGSAQGQGELSVRIGDAASASRWLRQLPGAANAPGAGAVQGEVELNGTWQGGWQRQGQELQVQAGLRAARLEWQAAGAPAAAAWRLRDVRADLSGTLRAVRLDLRGEGRHGDQDFALQAQARGGRVSDGVWQARLEAAQLSLRDSQRPGPWSVQLGDSVSLDWEQRANSRTLQVSAGTLRLSAPAAGAALVSWQPMRWTRQQAGQKVSTQWRSQGSLQGLPLGWIDLLGRTSMANLGLRGDLVFGGQWDATGGDTMKLRATLERVSGDLQVLTDDTAAGTVQAGVREARLLIGMEGEQLSASLRWDSERAGQLQADASTRLGPSTPGRVWPADAPLSGKISVKLPPVGAWSLLAPPGWRLRGTLDADAVLSGTLGAPQWRGTLRARDLAVRSVVDGIDFSGGTLQARLDGERLDIVEFTLRGAGGESGGLLAIKGSVEWLSAAAPAAGLLSQLRMELDAQAKALRLSARADRRLVVSGKLTARLVEARLEIRGALQADSALFILPDDSAPQLGDDVIVRGAGAAARMPAPTPAKAGIRVAPDILVTLDPGPDFQVRGRGLVTRLTGKLELRSAATGGLSPRITGELRTVRGSYKAYGQQLDIEEGVLRFGGAYDNPALDILAIRPNLQQRVGVQISGSALSPVVRLYAEPDLPDAEKLAWLVLGHSGAGGGAEMAILQRAALALLGRNSQSTSGNLLSALGLDELSVSAGTDSAGATSATVTLGKRLSRDFYVSYERSLAGTMGTFYIFYDLSRRFTLRAQTGEQSAVDLIFTLRYE